MMTTALGALLSHWRRRPLQLATLVMGLALATALWSAVEAINGEARASYARAAAVLGQDQLRYLASRDGGRLTQAQYLDLRRGGWLVSPLLDGEWRAGSISLRLLGIDPLTAPPQAATVDVAGEGSLLSFITAPGQFHVNPETAARLSAAKTPPLVLSEKIPPGIAITDIGVAQQLLGAEGQISRLLLAPEQPLSRAPLEIVAPGLVERQPATAADLSRLTDSFHLNLTAFAVLAFAVGLFIVHAAIGLAFEQRRPVFRTLRALGVSARALVLLLAGELLAFALIAGLAGVVIGLGLAALLLPDVSATLRGLYGAEVPGTLTLRPAAWLAAVAIALLGAFGSAARGFWQVWQLPLLAPAQPEAWLRSSQSSARLQSVAALVLFAAAGAIWLFAAGLAWGFALLACLLLAAALILPLVLALALRLGRLSAKGAVAGWFWADTRQQLPGLSLALMALLLALAANIGVGTMVASFRQTFTGWLDQRLASELYVTARDEDEAARLRAWLAPRSDAVLPIWHTEGDVAGFPVEIYGVADHATYRDNWPVIEALPGHWDMIARGDGALINEQLWRRAGLDVGSEIALPGGWRGRIAGVYSDYGNPAGQVMVGLDSLLTIAPDVPKLRQAVRVAPERAAALAEDLRRSFDLPPQNLVDQAAVKTFSLRTFDRTFKVTAALNVLTLGVAGLAIFTSLLTLAAMRLPQLAPVWALGLTRRRLAVLELLRAVMLAAVTALAALPLGLALAAILLNVINVEAFGWKLPMQIFPGDWLVLLLLALVAAALAALVPAWRLTRIAPAELLKVFAHER